MARIETDPNYTSPTFSRATAGPDLFKKEDVQLLASAVSLHTHNGAGSGLPITSLPATIVGTPVMQGLHVQGATALDTTLVVGGVTTVGSTLNVTGVTNANGGLGATTITSSARITSGADLIVGNGNLYLGAAGDTVLARGGVGLVNIQAAHVLANHQVDGTTTLNGAVTVPNNDVTVRGLGVVRSPRADGRKVDFGSIVGNAVPTNGAITVGVTFNQAFTGNPEVMVSVSDVSGGSGSLDRVAVGRTAITTTGFSMVFKNGDPGTQTIFGNWVAIGN